MNETDSHNATLLSIDIGNTHTTIALIEGDAVDKQWRLSTRLARTSDELVVALKGLMALDNVSSAFVEGVAIGSVVTHLTPLYTSACRRLLDVEPLVISGQTPMPIENGYADPMAVGVDRLANAVAGTRRYGKPLIVVDFGTATTLDIISAEGVYEGGVILPGPEMAADALFASTSRLPRVSIEPPPSVIGRTTSESIQSGVFNGTVGAVDALVARVREELGCDAKAVATGGLSSLFAEHCQTISDHEPSLTLLGLGEIWVWQQR